MLHSNQKEYDNIFLLKTCLQETFILITCTENKISYFLLIMKFNFLILLGGLPRDQMILLGPSNLLFLLLLHVLVLRVEDWSVRFWCWGHQPPVGVGPLPPEPIGESLSRRSRALCKAVEGHFRQEPFAPGRFCHRGANLKLLGNGLHVLQLKVKTSF